MENLYRLISPINPNYFDFTLHRTQYRVEEASNEVIYKLLFYSDYMNKPKIFFRKN
jgi:hypothetical protein